MPKISSKGALTSQGFGEFSKKAISTYKYIGQTKANAIYGTNSPNLQTSANWTLLPVQPTALTLGDGTGYGVIHYGNNITTSYYKSINGGAYSVWAGSGQYIQYSSGKNALIATNPTNKLTATINAYEVKGGNKYTQVYFVNSGTGVAGTTVTFLGLAKSICYSPQLNSFYVVYGSYNIRRFDGDTGADLGTVTNPLSNVVLSLSVSSDGYILLVVLVSGTTYVSYKMTSADFTTYSTLGVFSYSGGFAVTPWLWNPATSLYYFIRNSSGTCSLYSTDATTSPSFVNSFTTTGYTTWRQELMLNENNAMYFNMLTNISAGKSAGTWEQTFYSTDNGVTITASGINFVDIEYNPT